jgi:GTPase SAR1 family protein
MMVVGPTSSGKTIWVKKLLSNRMFTKDVTSVLYCYGVHQDLFRKMENEGIGVPIEFHEGLPSTEKIKQLSNGEFHVIVLDDLMENIINDYEAQALFTKYCHHYCLSVIFITQNLFAQGRCSRTIALNTHILVLFANKRDKSQIGILARQQCPSNSKALIEAYEDAVMEPYGYLVVDCSPTIHEDFAWRTKVFPSEQTICYVVKGK